jgi:hypothetical protein
MIGALTTEPGYFALTIDGVAYRLPKTITPEWPLRLAQSDLASGGVSVQGIYGGTGLPNVLDSFACTMPWDIDDTCPDLADAIEVLRAVGGSHDLCFWKQRIAAYTLAAAQQVIYLPRRDAYAAGYPAFAAAGNMLAAELNGTPLTTVYKTSVASGDSVPSGEIWVSETAISHPTTGKPNVARCKIGTTIAADDLAVVRYFPLISAQVVDVVTVFSFVGREDKVVKFVEVD